MGLKSQFGLFWGRFKLLKFHYFHYCDGPWGQSYDWTIGGSDDRAAICSSDVAKAVTLDPADLDLKVQFQDPRLCTFAGYMVHQQSAMSTPPLLLLLILCETGSLRYDDTPRVPFCRWHSAAEPPGIWARQRSLLLRISLLLITGKTLRISWRES